MITLRIPGLSHRGAHRAAWRRSEFGSRSVAHLLGCPVPRQEKPRHAKPESGEFLPSLENRLAALDSHNVVVSATDDFTPTDCHYCENLGAMTSVRVTSTVDSLEVCFDCAPMVIANSHIDQGAESDADIVVEVCA